MLPAILAYFDLPDGSAGGQRLERTRGDLRQINGQAARRFNRLRQVLETVNGQLPQQFNVATNHAHSFWGLCTRLYTKITPHTLTSTSIVCSAR